MMKLCYHVWCILLAACVTCAVSPAIPNPAHRARVADVPLSDKKHFDSKVHNPEYDHDAFLGPEEAKKFDELTPTESKQKLGILFVKIDSNADGLLSEDELKNWMHNVQQKTLWSESDQSWNEVRPRGGDFMTWEEYRQHSYGSGSDGSDEAEKRDKRRWERADTDKDSLLSRQEYNNFMHPEIATHMRDLVIQETLDEVDANHDGRISFEEYMSDAGDTDDEEEADWIKEEEEEFRNELDKNGDGQLDHDEIRNWLIPDNFDHINEESNHLFSEADRNEDGFLNADEVINNYELFVGSQATDYGDLFKREEL